PMLVTSASASCDNPKDICTEFWAAAHDVDVKQSFYLKDGHPIDAADIQPGDVLTTNRGVFVRYPNSDPAHSELAPDWGRYAFLFKKGAKLVVQDKKKAQFITHPGHTQWWLRIAAEHGDNRAKVPIPDASKQNSPNTPEKTTIAGGIWWETPIAEATAGYDP